MARTRPALLKVRGPLDGPTESHPANRRPPASEARRFKVVHEPTLLDSDEIDGDDKPAPRVRPGTSGPSRVRPAAMSGIDPAAARRSQSARTRAVRPPEALASIPELATLPPRWVDDGG